MTTAVPLLPPADWRDFLALTKPRVMTLVVFTGLCGMLAAPVQVHPVIGFTAILCIALGEPQRGLPHAEERLAACAIPVGDAKKDAQHHVHEVQRQKIAVGPSKL